MKGVKYHTNSGANSNKKNEMKNLIIHLRVLKDEKKFKCHDNKRKHTTRMKIKYFFL